MNDCGRSVGTEVASFSASPTEEFSEMRESPVYLSNRAVANADCVALSTPHSAYDVDWLVSHAEMILDTCNGCRSHLPSNVIPP